MPHIWLSVFSFYIFLSTVSCLTRNYSLLRKYKNITPILLLEGEGEGERVDGLFHIVTLIKVNFAMP